MATRLDIADNVAATIAAAGMDATASMAKMGRHAECCCVQLVEPSGDEYQDGSLDATLRVEVFVKRETEEAARDAIATVEGLFHRNPPVSANGSYEATSIGLVGPRAIQWDDAGFYVQELTLLVAATRRY